MGSGGSKKSSTPAPPAPPQPKNEYYYDNGFLRSSRVFDSSKDGYIDNTYSTPDEQAISDNATKFISGLVPKAQQAFNMDPAALDAGAEAYVSPQRRALNDSYNQALGTANTAANASGVRNSVGFERYKNTNIERNRAQGLADLEAQKEQMKYQLPSMALKPYTDAFNLYNAALNGQQAFEQASLEPSFQGSQSATNSANSAYQNQLNYYQLKNAQNQKRGGFFSTLFGGF